ncbi:hypothetical protein PIB30_082460, partial [Stylosanthes scabra]|nr:hypothetical protein [Stylosanthes scabra]
MTEPNDGGTRDSGRGRNRTSSDHGSTPQPLSMSSVGGKPVGNGGCGFEKMIGSINGGDFLGQRWWVCNSVVVERSE